MTQMLHNTYKQVRLSDSRSFGNGTIVLCGDWFKASERYEAPGAEGEVGVMRT